MSLEQINATPIVPKNEIVGNSVIRQDSETQVFLQKLLTLSQIRGEQQPKSVMNQCSDNGSNMLHQGLQIPILQMYEHSVGISCTVCT